MLTAAATVRRPAPGRWAGVVRLADRRRRPAPGTGSPPDTARQLAVLLEAGVAPAAAWSYLAEGGDPVATRVAAAAEPTAVLRAEGGAWTDLAATWTVATTVGAPLAETLRGIATALRDAAEVDAEVRVALAEPAATARLLSWLPLVGLALGAALGFDTLRVVTTTPFGIAAVVAGLILVMLARRWTATLVRAARPAPETPGLDAELLAVALSGGVSIARARTVCEAWGAPDETTERMLALSLAAGAPAVELLRAGAGLARHRARTDGRLRAARLSTRLLLPLGVCILPAFLLLGVAPMMLSVLTTTSLSL